jgi:hypothetical protein
MNPIRTSPSYSLSRVFLISVTFIGYVFANSAPGQHMNQTLSSSNQSSVGVVRDKTNENDGRHDFDFLFGSWQVRNRRLAQRLENCDEWQEFLATNRCRPLLGGVANLDRYEAVFPNGKPIEGLTLRCFDPTKADWSIYWNDSWTCQLQPPVVGRFAGNRGEFYGDDIFKGKPIRVRYIWSKLGRDSARWEQAFSPDGGKTWETNWIMDLTRLSTSEGSER